jgi:hypothetical protein
MITKDDKTTTITLGHGSVFMQNYTLSDTPSAFIELFSVDPGAVGHVSDVGREGKRGEPEALIRVDSAAGAQQLVDALLEAISKLRS